MEKKTNIICALWAVTLVAIFVVVSGQDTVIICNGLFPLTGKDAKQGGIEEAVVRKGIERINELSKLLFPNSSVIFTLTSSDTESTVSGALSAVSSIPISALVLTSSDRAVAEAVAPILQQAAVAHFTTCASEGLTKYSNIVQMVPTEKHQGAVLAELIYHFNWKFTVGVLSSSSPYGAELLSRFISRSNEIDLSVLASQQFYPGTQELWQIVSTVKSSQARVIVNLMGVSDMQTVIRHAERLDMLTDKYVWLCSDACSTSQIFTDPETGKVDEKLRNKFAGMLGTHYQTGHGRLYEEFLDEWEKEDIFQFAGSGKRETSYFAPYGIEALGAYLLAIVEVGKTPGKTYSAENIISALVNVSFEGVTGLVSFDNDGRERRAVFDIVNLRYDSLRADYTDFVRIGVWTEGADENDVIDTNVDLIAPRFNFTFKPQFHGGSYDFPDLDVRNSFDYWSCNDGEEKTDETGKSVRLEKPDGQGANNIDNSYRCDEFIDCYNMSDEWGCPVSFPVLFIVYGIFLFLFICFAVFCLIFTCVFGFCIRRKRIRASSPTFLIIMCLAAILGYGGLFAFFGQPHTVSCNFRVWFLAVAVITVISALFVKSFRVWRLYRSPTEIKALKDWQLILFVIASVIPVLILLVLWTGLSTPTAKLIEASSDDKEHLLCSYGSVAGMIGFYFFFFAIVAYVALFLLFGIFLSIATRNVVSTFNESRLIAISIYNITFSAIVTIPIVFVLKDSDPFITWIIIVTAFAYGFTATLVLQFFPKIWGIVVRDKFAKEASTQSGNSSGPTHASVTSRDSKAIF
eukprot:TRINITY_DN159_c0_g1_i13.p1 TRINITY_DN159_c0_g1~~TRINITY_DN159_c0_g1_i13.p1  ORF type:complete len:801 (-),score=334.83 TRINITY_DN159_c0_g1_i13:193-2595(-)